jgi:hypothetical protein
MGDPAVSLIALVVFVVLVAYVSVTKGDIQKVVHLPHRHPHERHTHGLDHAALPQPAEA